MPKQKTHKGLKKRVKITGTGKVKARKSFTGHLMSCKSSKKRRQLCSAFIVTGKIASNVKVMLGSS